MYRDTRPIADSSVTASTPDQWARNFAGATRVNRWKMLRFTLSREWRVIQRYVPRGSRILDAGCGFGEWVVFLKAKGYEAEGLDYSAELVQRLRVAYPGMKWTDGDIRQTPYASGTFDAIVSWGVIEHDESGPGGALREFHRLLQPGGVTIVTVPIDSSAQRRSAEVIHRPANREQVFFQYFMSDAELREQLVEAGFDVLESGTLPVAVLNLAFPALAKRAGPLYRAANFAAFFALSWMERYRVMRYCVARRRG